LVCNDLIDCQIDICSVEVPPLFTENFDYQDIRKDFLTGILESDLLGKTVYVDIVENGYAAHVSTQQMYKAVTNDLMMRWTYPLSPDNFTHLSKVGGVHGLHTHSINNIYKGDALFIDR
jgi:translation initiation factor eIF-2B subunit epsilon